MHRPEKIAAAILAIILLVLLVLVLHQHWIWIEHFLGFAPGMSNNPHYLFPSGAGSIIERLIELAVIGSILLFRHNCHSRGCPWIGRFPAVEGNGWMYCRKHHRNNGEHR